MDEPEDPGTGTGAMLVEGASTNDAGDIAGERAGAVATPRFNPQLLTEGAVRWHAVGRAMALVIFKATPS